MLACQGHTVDLILRPRFKDTLEKSGLTVTGYFGEFATKGSQLGLYTSLDETANSYNYALITTKAYDTASAAASIAALEQRVEYVVSMQNGCGNIELVEQFFGTEKTLGARVITGFEITGPGKVTITVSADDIHVGAPLADAISPAAASLAKTITEAGHPCRAVEDINRSLFAKLLYNCTLNPLGALLGVHYGLLGKNRETVAVMNRIIDETFAVITGLGGSTDWADSDQYKEVFYSELLPVTASHRPSMLQDMENHKPTEVDALIGYVSRQGQLLDIATPTCDTLAAMVKFKQAQYLQ